MSVPETGLASTTYLNFILDDLYIYEKEIFF